MFACTFSSSVNLSAHWFKVSCVSPDDWCCSSSLAAHVCVWLSEREFCVKMLYVHLPLLSIVLWYLWMTVPFGQKCRLSVCCSPSPNLFQRLAVQISHLFVLPLHTQNIPYHLNGNWTGNSITKFTADGIICGQDVIHADVLLECWPYGLPLYVIVILRQHPQCISDVGL